MNLLPKSGFLTILSSMIFLWAVRSAQGDPVQMERLDRGLVVAPDEKKALVSWRLFGTDPDRIAFDLYRKLPGKDFLKVNSFPITKATCWQDTVETIPDQIQYQLQPLLDGVAFEPPSYCLLPGKDNRKRYLSIQLKTLPGYTPNDASVGDLDGDGTYEIVLHQVGIGRDNSQKGFTTEPLLEAYRLDGTFLWRINLGKNIREGAHYTQFLVYDFDGDGKSEIICKTADGTKDGAEKVIGDPTQDHRNPHGYILQGPEYLTVFEGATGKAIDTVPYLPPRGVVSDWGDAYGNRVDRFLAGVAYLDGSRPSAVFCRGYYTRSVIASWNFDGRKLALKWVFDTDAKDRDWKSYRGQGNHNLSIGDVDGDGKDDIIYGSCVVASNGKGLYSTGFGHGDAMHFSDFDPLRPGLEIFKANGDKKNPAGIQCRDAATGKQIWGIPSLGSNGVVRACAMDIDPRHPGAEMWGKGFGVEGLFSCQGKKIINRSPRTCNMGAWWDGDLLRELLNGTNIFKWNYEAEVEDRIFSGADYQCVSNNGTKSNPCLCADILGDWREELILRSADNRELRIFSTAIPTNYRIPTLMHDRIYRLGIAWQNTAYNQPAHTSYFLGDGMKPAPKPNIFHPVKFK